VARGFDSALEITVTALRLAVAGKIDPDAKLLIVADGRLIHAASGAELYRRTWAYLSPTRNYFKDAGNNAQLMREDVEAGLDKLATKIVSDLFVSNTPEIQKSSGDPGTAFTVGAPTVNTNVPPQSPNPTANATSGATAAAPAAQTPVSTA